MSNFVQCHKGTWVNLDLVVQMLPVHKTDGHVTYDFVSATGERLGTSRPGFDPGQGAMFVRAHPGEAILDFFGTEVGQRPRGMDSIVEVETPILGWRCGAKGATPVTYEVYAEPDAAAGWATLHRMADGRFRDADGWKILETMEAVRTAALTYIQSQFNPPPDQPA